MFFSPQELSLCCCTWYFVMQVEMIHCKRLNVQKFSIDGTPRKLLYHNESKTLLVLRTGLKGGPCSSDICRVDPLSGTLLSKFQCEPGETAKCMQIVKVGNEQVLAVGTSQSSGRIIMPSGEAERFAVEFLVLSFLARRQCQLFSDVQWALVIYNSSVGLSMLTCALLLFSQK